MRKKLISNKRLIIAMLLSFCLLQAGWIPFEHKGQNQMPEVRLVASNELSMTFDVQLYGCDAQLINTKNMFNTNKGFRTTRALRLKSYGVNITM
jgi:hypothetical protein